MDTETETVSVSLPTNTAPTDVTSPPPCLTLPATTTTATASSAAAEPGPFSSSPPLPHEGSSSWDTSCLTGMLPFTSGPAMACFGTQQPQNKPENAGPGRPMEEFCRRSLPHFPSAGVQFPMPGLEFDFRVAVTLKPESSRLEGKAGNSTPREIVAVSAGKWSASFGNGRILAGGYDLGQARGFRPIRILEGVFIMQTTDDPPAILEMRTRGSLSGPCDVLDALLAPRQLPKTIDPRRYGFRMFSTIKTADKRYTETVNCGLWVASGVWRGEELIMDAYRVT